MKFTLNTTSYVFGDECITTFAAKRQSSRLACETGGQLFGRFLPDHVLVAHATETEGRSKRSRFGFWPDRTAEQMDIDSLFRQGLHYLGDWHTHPESEPFPSSEDTEKILGVYRESHHELQAMLMVIVGLAEFPKGLYVGAALGSDVIRAKLD